MICFILLSGNILFSANQYEQTKYTIINASVSDRIESKFNDHLSASAKDFLYKTLEKDPQKRWSCQMLLHHPWISNNLAS